VRVFKLRVLQIRNPMWMRIIRMFMGVPNENVMVTEDSIITLS